MKFWYIRYPFSCCLRNWAPERSILSKHILLPFLYATGDNCTCHFLSNSAAGTSTLKSMAILPARSATFLLFATICTSASDTLRISSPLSSFSYSVKPSFNFRIVSLLYTCVVSITAGCTLFLLGLRWICVSPTRWTPFFSKTETMGVLQLSTSVERVPNRNSLLLSIIFPML